MTDWILLAAIALLIAGLLRHREAAPPAQQPHLFPTRPIPDPKDAAITGPVDNMRFGPMARALAAEISSGRGWSRP